jgi:hypothetical protein
MQTNPQLLIDLRKASLKEKADLLEQQQLLQSQLRNIKDKIQKLDRYILDLEIKHSKQAVIQRPIKKDNSNTTCSKIFKPSPNRLKYDIEYVYNLLKVDKTSYTVVELVDFLNSRLDTPNYCIDYKISTFSTNLGIYLAKDPRFSLTTKEGNKISYALKEV